jgi:hypothetical protein
MHGNSGSRIKTKGLIRRNDVKKSRRSKVRRNRETACAMVVSMFHFGPSARTCSKITVTIDCHR